ncbi:H(+)/hexose cotransporter 1 [Apiospora arundinis]|uniref:Major facilitator superfamily (MFS) profile domain-containing protein n=1 Tax=Apiospora arundinis TaxID=335852 RepID=A0ABR2J5A0_9PEZI
MGGGTSIWASPEWRSDPREIFNWKIFYLTTSVAFAGCAYGFDQGNIGGVLTLKSFRHAFGLDVMSKADADERAGNIAAMLAAGGSAGALIAAPCADFLGRKKSMILYGLLFLIGATMQEIAHLGVFYAGRLIAGLAIGATSMLAPQYLGENSPKSVRGSLTTSYNLCIVLSLCLAFWVNYGISLWPTSSNLQWKLALAIQIIPGGCMFLMMFFVIDTPRGLISRGQRELGLKNLCELRNLPAEHPYVHQEYSEICAQVDAEQELSKGTNYWVVMKDIFTVRSNARRFFLATTLFVFHKFTGTDSLNYFAPEIFQMIGVKAGSLSLLTTGVYGLVKLATTIVYVTVIVDRVGRRKPLLIGATLQATAMLYIALYVKFAKPDSTGGTPAGGIIGIIWIYIYAFGWSFGHSVAPYITAAEIFPARIRSFSMSCCFFINWIVDYGITKATPIMMTKLGWGTFLLYSILTYIGCVFIYFCFPEFKGRSIESMDDLFQNSIWTMWRHAYPTEEEKVRHDVQDQVVQMAKDEEAGFSKKDDEATAVHRESR